MRKINYFILLLLVVLTFVGCSKNGDAVDVNIAQETVTFHHIELHVVVPFTIESMAELDELAYSIASQTYERHFDAIGTETYTLDIYLYDSQANYDGASITYGSITFMINETLTSPGLTVSTNHLTIA